MERKEKLQKKEKIGEAGFINKNCWLAKNVNRPPSGRCQYCELKFHNCLFYRYLIISLILIIFLLAASIIIEGKISKLVIVSVFVLVIVYGRFFDKSTESIIEANFAQKKAKEALQELTENLQQKVDEQTKEIMEAYEIEKKAKEDLEKLNEIKNEFMLVTQHHLRTPLTSMMGYMDLVEKEAYGKVPEKLKEVINKFGSSSQNLIKIVNEFLDISQFQLGKKVIMPQPGINLEIILEGIIKELAFQAKEKGIYLKFEKQEEKIPLISADPQKLQVALSNVIDNSIKYTAKGGTTIQLQAKDSKINIVIKDTGIGMEKKDIDNLFKNFLIRGEGAKKVNVTGRGIGLYLSSKIIEAHNGRMWAESEGRDKGSSFYIELPIK